MKRAVWFSLALPLLACGTQPATPDLASTTAALTVSNGHKLNGHKLNGHKLNGRELNGHELNGHKLNGSRLGASPVLSATLDGSELRLATDTSAIGATGVIGAELVDEYGERLRIDGARLDPDPDQGDVWLYTVSLRQGERWSPLCGTTDEGAPEEAIPLAGRWDYREGVQGGGDHLDEPGAITFACESGALAKCVHFGYPPWRSKLTCDAAGECKVVPLAAYHQACTRMVRADYCGNGRSYTRDGMLIDVYDGIGVEEDTDSWPFEAEWAPDGAVCLDHFRVGPRTSVPGCPRDLEDPACGDPAHFDTGTLLMTEYSPLNHPGHAPQPVD